MPRSAKRFHDLRSLRTAVLSECRRTFLKTRGQPWSPEWGEKLRSDHERMRAQDKEAVPLLRTLARSMKEVRTFVRSLHPESTERTVVVPPYEELSEATVELLEIAETMSDVPIPSLKEATPDSFRTFLMKCWLMAAKGERRLLPPGLSEVYLRGPREEPKHELMGLQFPTNREFAIISLLCGEFPAIPKSALEAGAVVSGVLDRETKIFLRARGTILADEQTELAIIGAGFEPVLSSRGEQRRPP